MYSSILLVALVATASATTGNIGLGLASGSYGNIGIPGAASLGSASSSVLAVTPVVSAGPAYQVPIATSSQSRFDVINPRPLVQQVVSSVPVDVPVAYTGSTVVGYGVGTGLNGYVGGYGNGYASLSSATYGNNGGSYAGGYSGYGGRGY